LAALFQTTCRSGPHRSSCSRSESASRAGAINAGAAGRAAGRMGRSRRSSQRYRCHRAARLFTQRAALGGRLRRRPGPGGDPQERPGRERQQLAGRVFQGPQAAVPPRVGLWRGISPGNWKGRPQSMSCSTNRSATPPLNWLCPSSSRSSPVNSAACPDPGVRNLRHGLRRGREHQVRATPPASRHSVALPLSTIVGNSGYPRLSVLGSQWGSSLR
jgi:hypothetical protein